MNDMAFPTEVVRWIIVLVSGLRCPRGISSKVNGASPPVLHCTVVFEHCVGVLVNQKVKALDMRARYKLGESASRCRKVITIAESVSEGIKIQVVRKDS